jgi:hypothetical protein
LLHKMSLPCERDATNAERMGCLEPLGAMCGGLIFHHPANPSICVS